ncbi:hypothetical protein A2311_00530 [candidate division WOR-1 bacterium RIFOXYB2_FULL_48_7]|uniref:Lipid-A-disaccharide synthase n=1 Tax=candidate division WOR-1 bacterium RIFOXYB2_FULL_48_7 TaxID=1802583 RepID=A0A1F4TTU3_UNCSA|nr:MAG: hypothetical protein A2311_00530 [candidate division WOR-1 bacterium RIFOXYB2_FULL_48_7]
MRNILLISNGHAEDLAAAEIGKRLKLAAPGVNLIALPLVGLGKAYDRAGINSLGEKKILPSGGFAKEGFLYLIKDLAAGLLANFSEQIRLLRRLRNKVDLIVGVGDAYLVALAGLFIGRPLLFVDGPKSVRIAGYWPFELWLLKRFCKKIIVQDQPTADFLAAKGLPAQYLGSWVMDYVTVTGDNFGLEKDQTVIGILPGTRGEAYDNLVLSLEVLLELSRHKKLTGLIASTLELNKIREKLASTDWELLETAEAGSIKAKLIHPSGLEARLVEGKFGDVCQNSTLIIGLAGIANEQAVAFGKPTVCFVGTGAQTTLRRWQEIQNITGKSMEIISGTAAEKAQAILAIMNNPVAMAEMAAIGKASKPQWGATERIVRLVLETI